MPEQTVRLEKGKSISLPAVPNVHLPVQTERVKECGKAFHQYQDSNGQHGPEREHCPQSNATDPTVLLQSVLQNHVPQHFSELCVLNFRYETKKDFNSSGHSVDKTKNKLLTSMSQRQSPQAEVRSGMRHGTQHILNRMNTLVDEDFGHFFIVMAVASTLLLCRLLSCLRARSIVVLVQTVSITVFIAVRSNWLVLQKQTVI